MNARKIPNCRTFRFKMGGKIILVKVEKKGLLAYCLDGEFNHLRTKVTLTGSDPHHTAVGYCRSQIQVKNWGYYYDDHQIVNGCLRRRQNAVQNTDINLFGI